MWLFMISIITFSVGDVDTSKTLKEMPCEYDYQCGEGDCWVGMCVEGDCLGFWKCV